MFGGDVARKAAVMQVQGLVADGKAALLKVVDRIGKKGIVISFKPDFPAGSQKGFVLLQLSGMGQPPLAMFGLLAPGIAEVDVNPLYLVLGEKEGMRSARYPERGCGCCLRAAAVGHKPASIFRLASTRTSLLISIAMKLISGWEEAREAINWPLPQPSSSHRGWG